MFEVAEPSGPRTEWLTIVQHLVQEGRAEVAPLANSDAAPIRPERLCKELTTWLPTHAVLVTDTGHSGIWTVTIVDAKDPNQRFIWCAGSLGWAFPSAMGVKCALPDRPNAG